MIKYYTIICILLLLCSCNNGRRDLDENINFNFKNTPYVLKIKNIEFINEYINPITFPHVEHIMLVSIPNIIKEWVYDSFQTSDDSNFFLRVTILNASVVEQYLDKNSTIGKFKGSQLVTYRADLKILFEVFDFNDKLLPKYEMTITSYISKDIEKDRPSFDHQELLNMIAKDLMIQFNDQVAEILPEYFGSLFKV